MCSEFLNLKVESSRTKEIHDGYPLGNNKRVQPLFPLKIIDYQCICYDQKTGLQRKQSGIASTIEGTYRAQQQVRNCWGN